MLRKFESSPDGSHLVKEWATQFNYLSTIWWGTDVVAKEKLTPELLQHRKDRVLDVLLLRGVTEKYRAIFAFDLGGRMRDIKVKTLVIEIRVPAEAHLSPQGPKILQRIPGSRLVTVQHTGVGRAIEVKAEELAENILSFLKEVCSARTAA